MTPQSDLQDNDVRSIRAYLGGFDLFTDNPQEGAEYLDSAFRRCMITLEMIPPAASSASTLLELGANPYFLTLLLQRFRRYQLTLSNFFGDGHIPAGKGVQKLSNPHYHEEYEFSYDHFNLERDPFPYPSDTFNLVLFCEILEHLLMNPTHALAEIHRVLKPDGLLLITTPNVLACQNVLKLAIGRNIYDRYSPHGIYGRHNREYTPLEVTRLLQSCGFDIAAVRLKTLYPHAHRLVRLLQRVRKTWRDHLFILARNSASPCSTYPSFLYHDSERDFQGANRKKR
ncbi:methyltransferase domain-containing protein [candidate division KSB3 bacterium]|uniref:Methyltransferase domain-containing protein n=1 Tax=candidate division KSB3 bacterium TaxID=2044937 RepID=A0A9D5JSE3_9BACT|nr:methyltransferase domain-containing protein [candidate division KSB3 bacterium]MBD3323121.1 methyltransferase domain-containing protein [candidate division KSB3 bacterium]